MFLLAVYKHWYEPMLMADVDQQECFDDVDNCAADACNSALQVRISLHTKTILVYNQTMSVREFHYTI